MTNQLDNHCEYVHAHKRMYTKIHRVAHQTDNNSEFGGNLGWKVGWPKRILVFSMLFRFCLGENILIGQSREFGVGALDSSSFLMCQ